MKVASRSPEEHVRVHIEDGEGHSIDIAVVGPSRRIRVEVIGPEGTVIRGDFEPWSFEHQLDLLRRHGADVRAGIAGRFQVAAVDESDMGGYVDWGNGGPTMWIYPNRRGSSTDWANLPMAEVMTDFLAVWEVHQAG